MNWEVACATSFFQNGGVSIQVVKLVIDNAVLAEYEKAYFAEHPKAKKKPIAQPYHESINKWMIMRRPQMNALKQKWKEFIAWLVDNSEYRDLHIEQCEIKFITYYGTARRHDIDNGCPKFILDGLCENGFIIDDDSKHITSLTMQCFVDTENPRTEIEVYVSKLLTDYKRPEPKEEKYMAKKKIKRISVNAMDEMMKDFENTKTIQWNGMDVVITCNLSLEDMLAFVDSVVKSCFDQTTGAYMPEVKDFAIRSNIMERYANFTLPSKVERQYDIVIRSGAVEEIMNHVNLAQFSQITSAIDAKLQNAADANVQMVFRQFNDVVSSFEGLQEKVGALFDGVDPTDIGKLMGAISEHGISEEKVVQAYIAEQDKKAE